VSTEIGNIFTKWENNIPNAEELTQKEEYYGNGNAPGTK